jgi:hypothetical protein
MYFSENINFVGSKFLVMMNEDSAEPIYFSDKELAAEYCLSMKYPNFLELDPKQILSLPKFIWFVIPDSQKKEKYILKPQKFDEFQSCTRENCDCWQCDLYRKCDS